MRQSTDLSEDQVRKSVGGVGNFLRMEENDESPAARDTVGHSLRYWALKLLPLYTSSTRRPRTRFRPPGILSYPLCSAPLAALGQDPSPSSPHNARGIQLRATRASGKGQTHCCQLNCAKNNATWRQRGAECN